MNASSAPVMTRQYLEQSAQWLRVLKRKENVSVVFFPKTDRLRRLQQLQEDKEYLRKLLGPKTRFLFQVMDFSAHNVEDVRELSEHIARYLNFSRLVPTPLSFDAWMSFLRKNEVQLVLIMSEAEQYLRTSEDQDLLSLFSSLVDRYHPMITVMSLFETDFTDPTVFPLMPASSRLYQNLFYYPLYSSEDSITFTRYVANKWNYELTKKQEMKILTACGGHFWLIKEAVRQLTDGTKDPFAQEGMRFRLRVIYELLLGSEQSVFEKIVTKKKNFTPIEEHSLAYLQKMNVIASHNHILIDLYHEFLLRKQNIASGLILKDERVLLNNIPLDKFLSRKEYRVLKVLLQKKSTIVSRDAVAAVLWPANVQEQYSDWAIDQCVARLRKRLAELALPPTLIQSIRGKGYLLDLK